MTQQLDPVSVAITIAGALVTPELAEIAGPYAVILLAATTGAGWSLGRREPGSRGSAVMYFLKLNATAVLLTVALATLVSKAWPAFDGLNWMLAPIGLLVGGIGDDWPKVGRWFLGFLSRRVDGQAGGGQQ
ncbi:MAG: hypothetical protein K2Q07_09920 [Burkholderiaceae bacterium]|nr:hypothetical protein [Burkholderiaceae bacterium]